MTLPYLVNIVLCLIYLISRSTLLTNGEYIVDEIRITLHTATTKICVTLILRHFYNINTIINETIKTGLNFISLQLIFDIWFFLLHCKNTQ